MDEGDLVQLLTDGEHGVQRGHGLLEDHGDLLAAQTVNLADGHLGDVVDLLLHQHLAVLIENRLALAILNKIFGVETDGTVHNLTGGTLDQTHDGHTGDRLAAAGLAHNAHHRVLGHVVGHAVDRLDHTLLGVEVGVQAVDLQNVVGVLHLGGELTLGSLAVLIGLQTANLLGVGLGDLTNLATG